MFHPVAVAMTVANPVIPFRFVTVPAGDIPGPMLMVAIVLLLGGGYLS